MKLSRAMNVALLLTTAAIADASAQQAPSANDPLHPRAMVLSVSSPSPQVTLLSLDIGSGRSIRSGLRGNVLEGQSEQLLENGEFVIVRVVNATQSIARLRTPRTLRGHRRVVIHFR
ncbi:MAG: hypothetical protein U0269_28505 [Polyangiales bacterium]